MLSWVPGSDPEDMPTLDKGIAVPKPGYGRFGCSVRSLEAVRDAIPDMRYATAGTSGSTGRRRSTGGWKRLECIIQYRYT